MIYVLSGYYILAFVIFIITTYNKSLNHYRLGAKLATSFGFIAIATYCAIVSTNISLYLCMLPAFIFCLIGDVMLALRDDKGQEKHFVLGLFAFLLGHILYVVAFEQITPFTISDLMIPAVAVLITMGLLKIRQMEAGHLKHYILLYSFFVSMLFSKGVSIMLSANTFAHTIILIGTALFLISDTIILFLYFYKKKYKLTPFFNLLTYYGAQFLLALSIMYV